MIIYNIKKWSVPIAVALLIEQSEPQRWNGILRRHMACGNISQRERSTSNEIISGNGVLVPHLNVKHSIHTYKNWVSKESYTENKFSKYLTFLKSHSRVKSGQIGLRFSSW